MARCVYLTSGSSKSGSSSLANWSSVPLLSIPVGVVSFRDVRSRCGIAANAQAERSRVRAGTSVAEAVSMVRVVVQRRFVRSFGVADEDRFPAVSVRLGQYSCGFLSE